MLKRIEMSLMNGPFKSFPLNSSLLLIVTLVTGLANDLPAQATEGDRVRSATDRPNIILIMADDMGYECLGCYGSTSYETPNLDRMASDGIRFDHCYSTPLCTPSRVQIMTGKYNFRNYEAFGYLSPLDTTFDHLLQDAGYHTLIAGKWQLNGYYRQLLAPGWDNNRRPLEAGFDECYVWQVADKETERFWGAKLVVNGEETYLDEDVYSADYFVEQIGNFMQSHQDEPFFVYYPMLLVHNPFIHTPDSQSKDVRGQQAFADMVAYTDKVVGQIKEQIHSLGLAENTIIIFTGDNGTNRGLSSQLGELEIAGGKGTPLDAGTHVPMVVEWHGQPGMGTDSQQLIDFTDFVPTLMDAAGAELPDEFVADGFSFLPTLLGERDPASERSWSFCHYDPRWGRFPAVQFVRTQQYKLYNDGRFYDVPEDRLEENILATDSLGEEQSDIRNELRSVLDGVPRLPPSSSKPGTRYAEPIRDQSRN